MAEFLLIHIDNSFQVRQLISYDDGDKKAVTLPAEQLKSAISVKKQVVLLLPASWVYLTHTNLASRSSDILEKSIPFHIEDELANDVEDNDYAWKVLSDHRQSVAVISKEKRHQINDFIKKQQLSVTAIYSEAMFCPALENHLTLWQDTDQVILRFGLKAPMATSVQQAPHLIRAFGQPCQHMLTNHPDDWGSDKYESVKDLTLAECCDHLLFGNEVNLNRADYEDNHDKTTASNWRKPLWTAAVLLLSWLFVTLYQGWHLSEEIAGLKSKQTQLLKNHFGQLSATEERDPYAAMQSRLKQLTARDQPNNILLDGIYFLGEARQQNKTVAVEGLRLTDNNLEIQIIAPSISVINSYRDQLQDLAADYRINIGVNELNDGEYHSILTLKPR